MSELEQLARENIILRPFKQLAYQFRPQKVFLEETQYCHILDRQTGNVETLTGPVKTNLGYDQQLVGNIEEKIVIPERHYVVVDNPHGEKGIQYGQREIRVGPQTFPAHFGEHLGAIQAEHVLTKYDGLCLKALKDTAKHKAGEEYLIIGPARFIPSKDEHVISKIKGIPLSDTEGIYVQNKDTGDATLITGKEEETIYFLQPNEQLYQKELTKDELQALGLLEQKSSSGVRVLTRQAANESYLRNKSNALVLELIDNEIVKIFDGTDIRIEEGPKTTFLGPYERPKVLNLSGGKPIEQGALKVALLKKGPDFIYDQITVRTKDNAQLLVDVTYKWRFDLEAKDYDKAFSIDDFVGYAAETLSSDIRAVAAKHDFEDFHKTALQYSKEAIFGTGGNHRTFAENGLQIFGLDITAITPNDPNIADKLHEAIKKNMEIYCERLVLTAKLDSERRETEGKIKIEGEKKNLIQSQVENYKLEKTSRALAEAEAEKIRSESVANSTKTIEETKIDLEQKKLHTIISELSSEGGKDYIELQRVTAFSNTRKYVVVPTDSKIVLPNATTG